MIYTCLNQDIIVTFLQLTPEGCNQLLQAAAAAAAATTDPLQQQAILQQFAAQGVAIAQVGLLQPQFSTQQHGMQVQQDHSMMGTTVTSSAAAALHLATVQQMQQFQQQQQAGVTVLGQNVAGKRKEGSLVWCKCLPNADATLAIQLKSIQ